MIFFVVGGGAKLELGEPSPLLVPLVTPLSLLSPFTGCQAYSELVLIYHFSLIRLALHNDNPQYLKQNNI